VLALPICLSSVMLASPVIHFLYGPQYAAAVSVMQLLALCVPAMYLGIMLNQVLVAANRPMVWTWIMVTAAIVNPTLNWFLIHYYERHSHNGAIGAAISLVLTEVLVAGLGVTVLGRRLIGVASLRRFARTGLAVFGMWGVMSLTSSAGFVPEAVLGWLAFLVSAMILRALPARDIAAFGQAMLRRMTHRGRRPQVDPTTSEAKR
jgi:O-antigen/teichoic acid export membrane protein